MSQQTKSVSTERIMALLGRNLRRKIKEIQEEVEKSQITKKINNKPLCMVFSYLYPYHRAVAKVSRLSMKSVNYIESTEATGGA